MKGFTSESEKVRCVDGDKVYLVPREVFGRILFENKSQNKKYVRYKTGAELYDMGERKFMKMAQDAGAIYKLDRLVLVNLELFEKYMQTFRI